MKVVQLIVGALLIAGVAALLGSFVVRMVEFARALIRLVGQLVGATLLAAVAGVLAGIAADRYSDFDGMGMGLVAALLFLPVALSLLLNRRLPVAHYRIREPGAAEPGNATAEINSAGTSDAPRPKSRSFWRWRRGPVPPIRPKDDAVLAAFEAAAVMADWAPSRVAAVRTSCVRFLQQADAVPLDIEAMEWASFIRSRVPELVQACATECEQATPLERETLVEDLLESLEAIGAEADRRRRQARQGRHSAFSVLREHVANRTRKASWL